MSVPYNRRWHKGKRLEHDVARRIRREGHPLRHYNLSEQSATRRHHPTFGTDMSMQLNYLNIERTIQVRSWESGFEACYQALGKKDIVANRMRGKPILVTMTLDAYLLHVYALERVIKKLKDED